MFLVYFVYHSQWRTLFDLRSVEKAVMTLYSPSLVFADGLEAKTLSLWLLLYKLPSSCLFCPEIQLYSLSITNALKYPNAGSMKRAFDSEGYIKSYIF